MNLVFDAPLESAINAAFESGNIQQHEWELRTLLRRALDELKPERTVELGTYKGFTAAILSLITTDVTVTIDIEDYGREQSRPFARNLAYLKGNGCSEKLRDMVVASNADQIDLLFIDDGHHYDETMNEYLLWKPVMRKGGWMCFHDINPLANIGPGGVQPHEMQTTAFWNDLKEPNKFEIIATAEHSQWRGVIPHGGIGVVVV